MRVYLITLVLIFLAACSNNPNVGKRSPSEINDAAFKIEFGKIIEVGGFYEMRPDALDFEFEDGYKIYQIPKNIEEKFGIRIENINKKKYNLAFFIGVLDESTNEYVEFSQGGYWFISPPNNPDYEAFLWENDKRFTPGDYKFVVMIDKEKVLKVVNFKIIES
ncbi:MULTISPECIES: DUF3859 domain-containing protein [Shewanella]|uniref:DUF3859 domain-containing protein n=1 Tax=Shewanella TaxID=22 RepID=UPI0006D66464|nr:MULTISPECIES: DUF3859 domain-containing protein [Shewanella]KPZ72682.1 hypothetical protein AN944_00924 [Shewanella sp. P1-14-1]